MVTAVEGGALGEGLVGVEAEAVGEGEVEKGVQL